VTTSTLGRLSTGAQGEDRAHKKYDDLQFVKNLSALEGCQILVTVTTLNSYTCHKIVIMTTLAF